MRGALILVVLFKLGLWLVLWLGGWVALVLMIGLDLDARQVGGGALLVALLMPVSITRGR